VSNPKIFPCAEGALHAPTAAVPACIKVRTWVLVAAVLGSTMAFVDESVVNVALPGIESDLHASLADMQWVINAYTLCMSALLLTGGAAADQFGRRLVFVIGICIFSIASIGCGLAMNAATLVIARGVQGIGAALLVPCSLALIGAAYEPHERGAAIGIWSGASAIAAGVAPLLGGWLLDHSSWRMIFLINPILAIPTLWITLRRVPESRNADALGGIDWAGALLAFAGLGCLVYGLVAASGAGAHRTEVLIALLASAVLLATFIRVEQRSRAPMMPLELFHSRRFSGVNLLTLLLYGALGGAFFFVPFLLIQAFGHSATAAGAVYLPFTLILGVLSRWSGGLTDRYGARLPLVVGPSISALGLLLLSVSASYAAVLASMSVLGFGMAITVAPLTATVLNAVPESRTGTASGINNAVASTGGLLLIALLGSICLVLFDGSLERHLAQANASAGVRAAVETARDGFVIPRFSADLSADDQRLAHQIVADALAGTIRTALRVAALLALGSALVAAGTIRSGLTAARQAAGHGAIR
jgi:EmrB/QacA subfamily drug resistance transporter